ncbi:MAG: ABC transporter permease [Pseudomonadota bacterium]|nr:ABC transporter permease [Pseudomonadota bacterium]
MSARTPTGTPIGTPTGMPTGTPTAPRRRDLRSALGVAIVAGFALLALVGPLLVGDPTAYVGAPLEPPSAAFWFGTTGQGQDVFAQTVVGARSTLLVGAIVGFAVVLVGAVVGATAAFFGGIVDSVLSLVVNVSLVMPGLPLIVVIAAFLPPGPVTMAVVLALTGWPWHARVVRAQVASLRRRDFVAAAQISGESAWRIVLVELLPNLAALLGSSFIGATLYAVGAQVGLEFLGLGDLSAVTWGTNLYWATNDSALLTGSWWTFVPTGLGVATLGFGLALLGFALDERANPRLAARAATGPGPQPTPVCRDGATHA